MPEAEIEIKRTVTITREEVAVVRVWVPQDVLDDPDGDFGLFDWVEAQMKYGNSELAKETQASWDYMDEDESIEYDEVTRLDVND